MVDTAFGGIYPVLVWNCRQYYGDDRILDDHYAGMKKWVDYLESLAPDHLMLKGTYGDHMVPGEAPGKEEYISKETPPPLIWTAYYYLDASVMAQAAGVLGRTGDARHYGGLAEEIKEAFNTKWLDRTRNQYAAGTQTANLIPLAMDLVPEANKDGVMTNVVKDIVGKHHGHFHAGDIGVTCVVDTLPEHGQGELLYTLATATTYPGWGYMVEQGASTAYSAESGHPFRPFRTPAPESVSATRRCESAMQRRDLVLDKTEPVMYYWRSSTAAIVDGGARQAMEIQDLGSLQIRVLEMLWSRGEATAGELWAEWPGRPRPAYTTVLSALQKLYRRKLAGRRKRGRAHAYAPRVEQEAFRRACVDALRGQVFGGSAVGMVAALLGGERVAADEIEEIRRLIRERAREGKRG